MCGKTKRRKQPGRGVCGRSFEGPGCRKQSTGLGVSLECDRVSSGYPRIAMGDGIEDGGREGVQRWDKDQVSSVVQRLVGHCTEWNTSKTNDYSLCTLDRVHSLRRPLPLPFLPLVPLHLAAVVRQDVQHILHVPRESLHAILKPDEHPQALLESSSGHARQFRHLGVCRRGREERRRSQGRRYRGEGMSECGGHGGEELRVLGCRARRRWVEEGDEARVR
jgi:hypothetical protein